MTSRLDRLFLLLENGSSAVTRRAAANQLGEVQRLHPHELHNLLANIITYLQSTVWDTRIAAGIAVEAILKNVPPWKPDGQNDNPDGWTHQNNWLSCDSFNLQTILSNSAHLMGSEGKEYDTQNDTSENDRDRLVKQYELVNSKLGLDATARLGFDPSNLYTPNDFVTEIKTEPDNKKMNVGDVVGLSCREANRAKRKARQAVLKQRSRDQGSVGPSSQNLDEDDEPEKKKSKLDNVPPENIAVPDNTGCWSSDAVQWPLEWFCSRLLTSIFSPVWEIRHGAGTALRHLMKAHGSGGGKFTSIPEQKMEECHQCWLEDIALRLVCVLTLDRFGDFVCDQVVAPVRETCAQALGSVVILMQPDRIFEVLKVLLQLLEQKDWETRHGGLLGIKYIFAVRQDLLGNLLPISFNSLHKALSDPVDDVGAVAGGALATSVDLMVLDHLDSGLAVLKTLCILIPEQDDLTPAANTFVPLLSQLLLKPEISSRIQADETVGELVRKLWSLLQHNNSSVRRAALQTLSAIPSQHGLTTWGSLLQPTLRHVFQRGLVEPQLNLCTTVEQVWCNIISSSNLEDVLVAACPFMTGWLCLAMQPTKLPFDPGLLIQAKPLSKESSNKRGLNSLECNTIHCDIKQYIGGTEMISQETREENALRARCMATRMLGFLSTFIVQPSPGIIYTSEMESPIDCYVKVLLVYLSSKSALQRLVVGLVVAEWAKRSPPKPPPTTLVNRLLQCVSEIVYYDEIALCYTRLLQDTKDFIALLKHYKLPTGDFNTQNVLTLDQMEKMCGETLALTLHKVKLKPKVAESLQDRRKSIHTAIVATLTDQNMLSVMTQAALSGAIVMLGNLPENLHPIVKPLMDSIKREENEELQALAADHLTRLIEMCLNKSPCPNNKIITNLCTYLRCDPEFTPKIPALTAKELSKLGKSNSKGVNFDEVYSGIITLINQQKNAERAVLKRCNSNGGRGPGRPPVSDIPLEEIFGIEDQSIKMKRIQRRGSCLALVAITSKFGPTLPTCLPILWKSIVGALMDAVDPKTFDSQTLKDDSQGAEAVVGLLQVMEVTSRAVHKSLIDQLLAALPNLICLLHHPYQAVRHMSARCLATLATIDTLAVMTCIVKRVIPMLSAGDDDSKRLGAVEAVAIVMEKMQINIVPYILFLIVPLMGRMSDQNSSVRLLATHTFANLIQLMPLDGVSSSATSLSPQLLLLKETQRGFLEQLFNPTSISNYKVPVPIGTELRSYQESGVNWLAFLNKFKLHGILCDDMGLGKTLQSICILAGDHYYRQQKYKETKQDDCTPLPSLVVCPPTLTGHWVFEVEKFISKRHLNPLQYAGTPLERAKLKTHVKRHNLIVASYDVVRKDIDFFSSIKWNYCILDEGHVIKNGKTKASIAIKQLTANHRLILSGTPIQNNVLELWSLFDFLMPGFLGTEKQFNARYSKPILASRDPKSSSKEQEAGVLAMEALHRQVLPFVLRRMKEDVLKDLPPKITQDYYCDLSPLQVQLYEDFSKSQAHHTLAENVVSNQPQNTPHIFQALRYLQNVCNHPKLALSARHPQFDKINEQLESQKTTLSDIHHAAKLPALKQLLTDCGIGVPRNYQNDDLVVNQHRVLIFCQLKAMLDIIENDLFKSHMPFVSYLRLDGSVPATTRHTFVRTFNNDPSIDVLLLTTQVGGLGLNLTGADTVIFVEHDWSPMRDLQAMDRAHRIGQKKVVNVYRLITRGTLEEKIMGLQKFKLKTANTVISAENAGIETMGTDKLLDLFSLDGNSQSASNSSSNRLGNLSIMPSTIKCLPELWEHKDYEEEYDLSNFVKNLRS